MRPVLSSIEAELRRSRSLAERAMAQLDDAQLVATSDGNSVATIAWHVASNLRSRFTDFLTSDGEKPWRDRESEFVVRDDRTALETRWQEGWTILEEALSELDDGDLAREVRIRGQSLTVLEALHRALGHVSYHAGQIVQLAREARGDAWVFLSIPPGESDAYSRNPTLEKPPTNSKM